VDDRNTIRDELHLRVVPADGLASDERREIIALCTRAFDEDFANMFALLPRSTHVLAHLRGVLVGHACWVTRWLQPDGHVPLRTAYVEAVATDPAQQRRGVGKTVMRRLAAEIERFELGGLSPACISFYEGLGWELWTGPTAIRMDSGVVATPAEKVMILRTPSTPVLNVSVRLTAEWREGELW